MTLRFFRDQRGNPCVQSDQATAALARFLEEEAGAASRAERYIGYVEAAQGGGSQRREEVGNASTLILTSSFVRVEHHYAGEPVDLEPAKFLQVLRVWSDFVQTQRTDSVEVKVE